LQGSAAAPVSARQPLRDDHRGSSMARPGDRPHLLPQRRRLACLCFAEGQQYRH